MELVLGLTTTPVTQLPIRQEQEMLRDGGKLLIKFSQVRCLGMLGGVNGVYILNTSLTLTTKGMQSPLEFPSSDILIVLHSLIPNKARISHN